MRELVQPGGAREECLEVFFFGTSGERKLYMVLCHICHIYGI